MTLQFYSDLTWPEIEKLDRNKTCAIIPMGAIEQHGSHMFVDTDARVSIELSKHIGARIDSFDWLVLPPLYYGYAKASEVFPGTLSINGLTLSLLVKDILSGILRQSFQRIVILNSNYENVEFIGDSASDVLERFPQARLCIIQWWEFISDEAIHDIFGADWHGWGNEHAGIMETSLMLHCNEQRVRLEGAQRNATDTGHKFRFRLLPYDRKHFSPGGATVRPNACSSERGKRLLEEFLSGFEKLVQEEFSAA